MKKQGLKNPALLTAVASTKQGQKAISDSLTKASASVESTATILKGIFKIALLGGLGYFVYKKIFNGFTPLVQDKRYAPSNISTGVAKSKAQLIYRAMYGVGSGFKQVKQNLLGVNHNGFIRIYNEFGKKKGLNPLSKNLNLIEWFEDQFSPSELMELRFLLPNFF